MSDFIAESRHRKELSEDEALAMLSEWGVEQCTVLVRQSMTLGSEYSLVFPDNDKRSSRGRIATSLIEMLPSWSEVPSRLSSLICSWTDKIGDPGNGSWSHYGRYTKLVTPSSMEQTFVVSTVPDINLHDDAFQVVKDKTGNNVDELFKLCDSMVYQASLMDRDCPFRTGKSFKDMDGNSVTDIPRGDGERFVDVLEAMVTMYELSGRPKSANDWLMNRVTDVGMDYAGSIMDKLADGVKEHGDVKNMLDAWMAPEPNGYRVMKYRDMLKEGPGGKSRECWTDDVCMLKQVYD